jgi:hypothetical protein
MIGKFLYSVLGANPNLVREMDGDLRIYPLMIPQGEDLPALVYQTVSSDPVDSTDGPAKIDLDTIQITCYHKVYDQAHACMKIVRAILDRYRGTAGDLQIDSIQFLTKRDAYDDKGRVMGLSHDYKFRMDRALHKTYDVNQYNSDQYEIGKT